MVTRLKLEYTRLDFYSGFIVCVVIKIRGFLFIIIYNF